MSWVLLVEKLELAEAAGIPTDGPGHYRRDWHRVVRFAPGRVPLANTEPAPPIRVQLNSPSLRNFGLAGTVLAGNSNGWAPAQPRYPFGRHTLPTAYLTADP